MRTIPDPHGPVLNGHGRLIRILIGKLARADYRIALWSTALEAYDIDPRQFKTYKAATQAAAEFARGRR